MRNVLTWLLLLLTISAWSQHHETVYSVSNYAQDAVSILADGTVLEGSEKIANHWQTVFGDAPPIRTQLLTYLGLRTNITYSYELSRWMTNGQEQYAQLIIWDNRGNQPLRALEFIVQYDEGRVIDLRDSVDVARQLWMQYCNAHEVETLIEELYTDNTLYYNHRPLLKGRTALVKEYAYMKRPTYNLQLTPIYTEPVNDHLIFEIGQCSGSYGGKYIIVWEKQPDGRWQVLLDANL